LTGAAEVGMTPILTTQFIKDSMPDKVAERQKLGYQHTDSITHLPIILAEINDPKESLHQN